MLSSELVRSALNSYFPARTGRTFHCSVFNYLPHPRKLGIFVSGVHAERETGAPDRMCMHSDAELAELHRAGRCMKNHACQLQTIFHRASPRPSDAAVMI